MAVAITESPYGAASVAGRLIGAVRTSRGTHLAPVDIAT
jgi:hypothetical protein